MKFIRVGGLSAIRQRGNYKVKDTYHCAPERYGLYAFIYPYFEPFLALWSERNRREFETNGYRIFEYTGDIWTHLRAPNICLARGDWYRTHTSDLAPYMNREFSARVKEQKNMLRDFEDSPESWRMGNNNGKTFSLDHLEVFIPGKI